MAMRECARAAGWSRTGGSVPLSESREFEDGPDASALSTLGALMVSGRLGQDRYADGIRLSEVLAGTVTRRRWLDVTNNVARERTAADPTRPGASHTIRSSFAIRTTGWPP